MADLKPCPFCGGTAEQDYAFYDYNWHGVHCTVCGAYVCTAENDPKEAIEAWNRRCTPSEIDFDYEVEDE